MPKVEDWRQTAWHELAHVAGADAGGLGWSNLIIDGARGQVTIQRAITPEQVRAAQVVDFCGRAAEKHLARVTGAHVPDGADGDRAIFAEHARMPGAISQAKAERLAERIVAERAPWIEAQVAAWGRAHGYAPELEAVR